MVRGSGVFQFAATAIIFIIGIFLTFQLIDIDIGLNLDEVFARSVPAKPIISKPVRVKCGVVQACPTGYLTFKIASGVANMVGPRICLEDKILMSSLKNNVGKGINIVLVNGKTGKLLKTANFNMWDGDVAPLITFLKEIEDGTVVMMASFDDPATKLNDEARKLISDLGSKNVTQLALRDNWIFVGEKGIKTMSPFEQHIKNNADTNKFERWPDVLQMEGCIPMKVGQL